MADKIELEIEVTGAPQAAQGVEQVATALDHEKAAATGAASATSTAGSSMQTMGQRGQQLAQRMASVANAVQSLVSATGSENSTAGLVASVASTTAQFAAMGATLGPHGAVIGGLVGLTAGLIGAADAATRVTHSVEEMNAELARRARVDASNIGEVAWAELERLNAAEERRLADQADDVLTSMMADAERDLSERGRGGGGGRREVVEPGAAMTEEALDLYTSDISDREIERRRARDEEFAAMDAERFEETMELIEAESQARLDADRERLEAEEEKQDAILEMNAERLAKEEEAEEAARQRQIEAQTEFMELGMNVVGLMTDALGAIASGEKTAEDAFKGLAKAFLQMISQYAMLKAATEFAEAIGAFASFNYGGGALHLAAGVAFTAVAVATGVGAAAINVSKPTAPARPEADKNAGSGGKSSGDTIINWNSPVITASTRDDLGRELGAMVDAGRARYG